MVCAERFRVRLQKYLFLLKFGSVMRLELEKRTVSDLYYGGPEKFSSIVMKGSEQLIQGVMYQGYFNSLRLPCFERVKATLR